MRPLQNVLRRRLGCLPDMWMQRECLNNGQPKVAGRLVRAQHFLYDKHEWLGRKDISNITARSRQKCIGYGINCGVSLLVSLLSTARERMNHRSANGR